MLSKAKSFDTFAGIWVDPFRHELHVAVTDDAAGATKKLQPLIPRDQTLYVHVFPHTHTELQAIQDSAVSDWQGYANDGIFLSGIGVDDKRNCVEFEIDPVTPEVVAKFTNLYGAPIEFEFSPRPMAVPSTWPTEPEEVEAVETTSPAEPLVTCGGHAFPASVLARPDVEDVPTDLANDLQAAIDYFSEDSGMFSHVVWRLAYRDDSSAQFVGKLGDGWVSINLEHDAKGWRPTGGGGCQPVTPSIDGAGQASWAFDPQYGPPTPDSTELHVLITELACSGGIPAFGRIVPAVVVYSADSLTLKVGVRPVGGIATCPGNPLTPATIKLPRPLGNRAVLDGNVSPPAPPGTPEPFPGRP